MEPTKIVPCAERLWPRLRLRDRLEKGGVRLLRELMVRSRQGMTWRMEKVAIVVMGKVVAVMRMSLTGSLVSGKMDLMHL